jgi:hypothetical protein
MTQQYVGMKFHTHVQNYIPGHEKNSCLSAKLVKNDLWHWVHISIYLMKALIGGRPWPRLRSKHLFSLKMSPSLNPRKERRWLTEKEIMTQHFFISSASNPIFHSFFLIDRLVDEGFGSFHCTEQWVLPTNASDVQHHAHDSSLFCCFSLLRLQSSCQPLAQFFSRNLSPASRQVCRPGAEQANKFMF